MYCNGIITCCIVLVIPCVFPNASNCHVSLQLTTDDMSPTIQNIAENLSVTEVHMLAYGGNKSVADKYESNGPCASHVETHFDQHSSAHKMYADAKRRMEESTLNREQMASQLIKDDYFGKTFHSQHFLCKRNFTHYLTFHCYKAHYISVL